MSRALAISTGRQWAPTDKVNLVITEDAMTQKNMTDKKSLCNLAKCDSREEFVC